MSLGPSKGNKTTAVELWKFLALLVAFWRLESPPLPSGQRRGLFLMTITEVPVPTYVFSAPPVPTTVCFQHCTVLVLVRVCSWPLRGSHAGRR